MSSQEKTRSKAINTWLIISLHRNDQHKRPTTYVRTCDEVITDKQLYITYVQHFAIYYSKNIPITTISKISNAVNDFTT
ncbi:hypothetical protein C2G38_2105659 [Gigaspora rosea]|uniref:Uncharacterized protein n=1 Tax=Gigaspora rosea TaxID=44941 RepID=A0A397UN59_9GLOM|nr:hypothetical protein C2G38_2105659 [Gigaspora rosea]